MQKWEYLTVAGGKQGWVTSDSRSFQWAGQRSNYGFLAQLGEEGWELVSETQGSFGHDEFGNAMNRYHNFIFKRPL